VLSYCGFGLIALGLIWIAGPTATARLYLAALMAAAVYVSFFATVFLRPRYGGALTDQNGYPPFRIVQVAGRTVPLDMNVTVFCVQAALLVLALLAMP
jgi:hypothetical protein